MKGKRRIVIDLYDHTGPEEVADLLSELRRIGIDDARLEGEVGEAALDAIAAQPCPLCGGVNGYHACDEAERLAAADRHRHNARAAALAGAEWLGNPQGQRSSRPRRTCGRRCATPRRWASMQGASWDDTSGNEEAAAGRLFVGGEGESETVVLKVYLPRRMRDRLVERARSEHRNGSAHVAHLIALDLAEGDALASRKAPR